MLLKLQDIPVADALSRKFLSDTFPELSDSMDALVHSVMSSIPIYDTRLDETRVIMSADPQSHYEWLARQPARLFIVSHRIVELSRRAKSS